MESSAPSDTKIACKKPTKTQLVIAFFSILSYSLDMFLPNNAVAAAGSNVTENFCIDHQDLCNQHQVIDDEGEITTENLFDSVKSNSYIAANYFSIAAVVLVTPIIYGLAFLPDGKCCKFLKKSNNEASKPLLNNNNSSTCSSLFKKFKKNVFPTNFEIYQLIATAIPLILASSFVTWLSSILIAQEICSTQTNSTCDNYANITNPHLVHELQDLADDTYNAMMSTGIILTTFSTAFTTLAIMSFISVVKHCVTRREEEKIKRANVNRRGSNFSPL